MHRAFGLVVSLLSSFAVAEEAAAPANVRITFLPPPLEGTLSAGVFAKDGKLVRILAREATDKDFTVGLNGLITHWDGKDDAGQPQPAGKYFVRGFAVGEVDVEGVEFHGNDWLGDDDVLRVVAVNGLTLAEKSLELWGHAPDKRLITLSLDRESQRVRIARTDVVAQVMPPTSSPGKGGTLWTIEKQPDGGGSVVVQKAADGSDVLRELAIPAAEPQPYGIAAATDRDEFALLEMNDEQSRVRVLRLKETKEGPDGKPVSEWEVVTSKSIRRQESFADVAAHVGRAIPPVAEERVRVVLRKNELMPAASGAISVTVVIDEKGSLLRTLDGLPLRRLTDTANLKWAVLIREAGGALTLLQSDGAVVEEFKLGKLDQMMAFDAGDYDWTPAK